MAEYEEGVGRPRGGMSGLKATRYRYRLLLHVPALECSWLNPALVPGTFRPSWHCLPGNAMASRPTADYMIRNVIRHAIWPT